MQNLKASRLRRSRRTRAKIAELKVIRLSVHRTNLHIYAQLIDDVSNKTIASASTIGSDIRKQLNGKCGNVAAASLIGKLIAEKAKQSGIDKVAFDRSGYKYHGRVKALADAARENGLNF